MPLEPEPTGPGYFLVCRKELNGQFRHPEAGEPDDIGYLRIEELVEENAVEGMCLDAKMTGFFRGKR